MRRSRSPSPAARKLLQELAAPWSWRHGYDLARVTGLKSGTLYPLLMRLNAEGLLEAEWRPPAEPGRPARHVYRLSDAGMQFVRTLNEHPDPVGGAPVPRGAS